MSLIINGALALYIVNFIGNWKLYKKIGRKGWESIIPLYNRYVIYESFYGNGWRILCELIPIYGLYVKIKKDIDLCHGFNKRGWWVIGYFLWTSIFNTVFGLSNMQFKNGSFENMDYDIIDQIVEKIEGTIKIERKKCPKCGTILRPNSKYCQKCGEEIKYE